MVLKTICMLCFIYLASRAVSAIQINHLKVPAAVLNDSKRPTVVDCDYALRPDDTDLAVRWYLNQVLVYEWSPPRRPQSFGPMQGRLDLGYRATGRPEGAHRAMRIRNPTDDVAGEYKCLVSTSVDEDFSVRSMKVFVPEKSLVVFKNSFDENYTNFACLASEVYPIPKLHIYKTCENEFDKNRLPTIHREITKHNTSLFSSYIIASAASETLYPGSLILCEVRIPGTGYSRIKSLLYYPEGNTFNISAIWKWVCILSHVLLLNELPNLSFK